MKLGGVLPSDWTLVSAQMVALHGFEAGKNPTRASTDADLVVNARIVGTKIADFARALEESGYTLEGMNSDGIGHTFTDGCISFDLLAPDGLASARLNLRTVGTARTDSVPGGTQALRRTETVEIQVGGTVGVVPRPNLAGAILIKARAVDVDDVPRAQLADLAFLLSLIKDPAGMREELSNRERGWLRRRTELSERDSAVRDTLAAGEADDALAAFQILTD